MIYLDNASTTKPSVAAINAVTDAMEHFGNPSSLHSLGLESEKIIEKARASVASILGADKKNILFTSGGTEANNTAIFGCARALKKRGTRIITSKIEHPSVLESFRALENEGFEVIYLNSDKDGRIDVNEAVDVINDKTSLVSIMTVNNETGIIQPVAEISRILHKASPFGLMHTDAVQAFKKTDCSVKATGADLITVSSHKIHGPKGVGALYLGNSKITPLLYGGQQQKSIRPGTENVPGIAGFGAACEESFERCDHLYDRLKDGIINSIEDIKINGNSKYASKYVLNVSFLGVKSEVLLHSLERYNIFVSTGSACSSHKPEPSHVLKAMSLTALETDGAIRFSFSKDIKAEDIDTVLEALTKEVASIRKYTRR